jgi:putative DNA primase/helicase
LLNTPSGTVDLRTGEMREHDPHDYITKISKVAPKAGDCTIWKDHLQFVLGGDTALIDYHQRLFGYCLTGFTQEKQFCFAHGEGDNGKSVTFETVMAIMGDYAKPSNIDTFTATNNEQHPTGLADLAGARLVLVSETESGKSFRESTIKQLTGGDTVAARFMRQDFFRFKPQCKLIIFGNHKPSLRSVNTAMRTRIHMLPYNVRITAEMKIKDFGQWLASEHEEILAWMIAGAKLWHEQGLQPPQCVIEATDQYFGEQDKFGMFAEDYLDLT